MSRNTDEDDANEDQYHKEDSKEDKEEMCVHTIRDLRDHEKPNIGEKDKHQVQENLSFKPRR